MSLQRLKVVNKRRGFKIILNSFVKWFSSECSVHQLWLHSRLQTSANIKYFSQIWSKAIVPALTYQTCTIDTTCGMSSLCYSPLSPPRSSMVCQCLVWRKLCRSSTPRLRNADVKLRVRCRCCRLLSGDAEMMGHDQLHARQLSVRANMADSERNRHWQLSEYTQPDFYTSKEYSPLPFSCQTLWVCGCYLCFSDAMLWYGCVGSQLWTETQQVSAVVTTMFGLTVGRTMAGRVSSGWSTDNSDSSHIMST